jgi:hypothetical protein
VRHFRVKNAVACNFDRVGWGPLWVFFAILFAFFLSEIMISGELVAEAAPY